MGAPTQARPAITMTVRDANAYLEGEQIEALDQLVDDGDFDSRSDAIREAVDDFLEDRDGGTA